MDGTGNTESKKQSFYNMNKRVSCISSHCPIKIQSLVVRVDWDNSSHLLNLRLRFLAVNVSSQVTVRSSTSAISLAIFYTLGVTLTDNRPLDR